MKGAFNFLDQETGRNRGCCRSSKPLARTECLNSLVVYMAVVCSRLVSLQWPVKLFHSFLVCGPKVLRSTRCAALKLPLDAAQVQTRRKSNLVGGQKGWGYYRTGPPRQQYVLHLVWLRCQYPRKMRES